MKPRQHVGLKTAVMSHTPSLVKVSSLELPPAFCLQGLVPPFVHTCCLPALSSFQVCLDPSLLPFSSARLVTDSCALRAFPAGTCPSHSPPFPLALEDPSRSYFPGEPDSTCLGSRILAAVTEQNCTRWHLLAAESCFSGQEEFHQRSATSKARPGPRRGCGKGSVCGQTRALASHHCALSLRSSPEKTAEEPPEWRGFPSLAKPGIRICIQMLQRGLFFGS